MTHQPFASGATGQAARSSAEFGATTVSGKPRSNTGVGGAGTTSVPVLPLSGDAAKRGAPPTATTHAPAGASAVPTATHQEPRTGSSVPGTAATAEAPARVPRARGPRRARLQLRHINPWTVLKFSCVLSIALFFVWLIVVGILYGVLDAAGVIGKVNDTVTTINGPGSSAPVTAGIVFGGAAIIGMINIILFVALSTIGSVVYNLCADLVGGIELTLSER
jgi:hypothetical protein